MRYWSAAHLLCLTAIIAVTIPALEATNRFGLVINATFTLVVAVGVNVGMWRYEKHRTSGRSDPGIRGH